ncbi:unnamed protein product [Symbiodinium natans]|uniref:VWFA domain-containing protein n=1 Tax=Symbiodinium natans TaxID=878477 RepID=A0A812RIU7_9DINO|nr:unnamed protein product [Symbiodinium natans]
MPPPDVRQGGVKQCTVAGAVALEVRREAEARARQRGATSSSQHTPQDPYARHLTADQNELDDTNDTNFTNDTDSDANGTNDTDSDEVTNTTTSYTTTSSTYTTSTDTVTSVTSTTSTATSSTATSSTATSTSKTATTSTSSTLTKTTSTATTSTATTTSFTSTSSTATTNTVTSTSLTHTSSTSTISSTMSSTTTKTTTFSTTTTLTTSLTTATVTSTSTSTTSTTTIWGDIIIALDFDADADQRSALLRFAGDVVDNVTANAGGLNVSFGLVLFSAQDYDVALEPGTPPEDFLANLHSAGGGTYVAVGGPPDTAHALDVCSQALNRRIADVSIVVVVTNSESSDATQTEIAANHLKYEGIAEVIVIAVGMDAPDQRSALRQSELEQMATSEWFEYDSYYDQVGSARRLRSLHAPIALSMLAEKMIPQFSEVLLQITSTTAPAKESRGLGAGIILLAVLGAFCCFSCIAAVSFLVCKRMQEAEEEERKLSQVMPVQAAGHEIVLMAWRPLNKDFTDQDFQS